MEDPIRFDVWAEVVPASREAAVASIRAQRIYPSDLDLRKAVAAATRTGERLLVARALGYSAAVELVASLGPNFARPAVVQEGLSPATCVAYCDRHAVHYGGCLGCHVCSGFCVT